MMTLSILFAPLDYLVFIFFFLITFFLIYRYKYSGASVSDYFTAEGKLNWFVAGTAMAATTFAADTPLAVTELVAKYGIAGNWIWWYGSIGSLLTVYLFAPLWKKSGVITDIELIQLRYSGHGVKSLRIGKSIYMGFLMNVIILAWVNLAMLKISQTLFPHISSNLIVILLFSFALFYTILTGLSGISKIDVYQFFLAMLGCIFLAYYSINNEFIGGIHGLKRALDISWFNFIPDFNKSANSPFSLDSFIILLTITWWASWYPGAEPGGGGYIAQRIIASENEKSAVYSTLLFVILHYFVRPWPWIIAALASLVLFHLPEVDQGKGYIMILEYTPPGVKGLMLVSFIAAYLSTLATHLNWGSSYIINDVIKPLLIKNKNDKYYLNVSKIIQIIFMLVSLIICFYLLESISNTWLFLIQASSGIGFVLIMRWFWWRINVWSEISGMIVPPIIYTIGKFGMGLDLNDTFLFTVTESILVIAIITIITPETDLKILTNFYKKVKPPGILWKNWAVKNFLPPEKSDINLIAVFILTISGIILVFSGLFLTGSIIFGFYDFIWIYSLLLIFSIGLTVKYLPKLIDQS